MSTKSRTTTVVLSGQRNDWSFTGGTVSTPYRYTVTCNRSRTGTSNPQFRRAIQSGTNASTGFSATEQIVKATPLTGWYNQLRYGKAWASGNVNVILGLTAPPDLHPTYADTLSKADASAIRALYAKMRSVRSQFTGGIELGQLRQTVHQMVRPAESLRKLILQHSTKMKGLVATQAKWVGPRRYLRTREKETLLRTLADLHLEAVYGWMPLLSDVRDAAVGLARLVHDYTPQRFRVWGSAEQANSRTTNATNAVAPFQLKADILGKTTVTVVYYGAFSDSAMATMAGPALSRLQDMSGFGLRDFVPTIWDLIPYSFVVDYFANIGDVLSAACTDTSVVARLTKVTIVETSMHQVWKITPNWYNSNLDDPRIYKETVGGTAGITDTIYRSVGRTPTGVPLLEPRFDLLGPSTRQWLNLGALYVGGRSQRDGYNRGLSFLYG